MPHSRAFSARVPRDLAAIESVSFERFHDLVAKGVLSDAADDRNGPRPRSQRGKGLVAAFAPDEDPQIVREQRFAYLRQARCADDEVHHQATNDGDSGCHAQEPTAPEGPTPSRSRPLAC